MFSSRAKSVLGLDIGASSVKLVEIAQSGGEYEVQRIGFAPLPPEAIVQGSFMNAPAIANSVREAYEDGGFKIKDVAPSVSGHSVIVKRIQLPSQSQEELDESIKWEAEQYIPFDINEVNVDYRRMLKIVKEAGFRGYIGIEFEGHDVDPVEGINATKRLIEKVMAELS